ncbi:MAG: hypothetical protein ACC628_08310 [Pirellulaceae bacterium]
MENHNADSFSIACTTCQAQLRVRDRSVVGQILTCPKCGSMVLVEPPDGAGELNRRRSPPPLPTPTSEADVESPQHSQTHATNLSDTVDDPTRYGTIDAPPEDPATTDEMSEDLPDANDAPEQPLLPTEAWTSESTLQWRRWLLIAVAGVLGVGLAVALLGWIVGRSRSEPPSTVATDPHAETEKPPREQQSDNATEPQAPETVDSESDETVKPPPHETPPDAAPEDVPADEPGGPVAPKSNPPQPPDTGGPDPAEKPAAPEDVAPPGFVTPTDPEKGEGMSPAQSLRKTLRAFGALIDDEPLPAGDAPESDGPTDVEAAPDASTGIGPRPRPAPRDVDVRGRLSDRFQQIDFKETPLTEFLQFVSDYSTILITLDPDVLPWLDLSPATPISISQTDSTVAALLQEALEPCQLGYTTVDDQILVTRQASADTPLREVTLNVSDLTEGNEDRLNELASLIAQMISPESWSVAGGPGTVLPKNGKLAFKQREVILFRVLELCGKLRVARGLPPHSKFPPVFFRLDSRLQKAQPRLNKRITVSYLRPTPFVRIVRRISKETGIHLLVDWRAAGQIGWNQDAMVTLGVSDQSAGEALNRLLNPMDLTIRIVTEDILQITTRSALEAHLDLEFYSLVDILSAEMPHERIESQIRVRLGEGTFRDGGGTGMLYFDSKSRHLIAALPQSKQAALAAMLAELR